jgi:ATP-dependent protease HslVU (ClpYQ) peptidase subunit
MSTIIAYVDFGSGVSYLMADRMVTAGNHPRQADSTKLVHMEDFVFGFCGTTRMQQLFQECLQLPSQTVDKPEKVGVLSFLHRFVIASFRTILEDAQHIEKDSDGKVCMPGEIAVLYNGEAYIIHSNFSLGRVERFIAIGSGWEFATGALEALHAMQDRLQLDPPAMMHHALGAAAQNDVYTGTEFNLSSTTRNMVTSLDAPSSPALDTDGTEPGKSGQQMIIDAANHVASHAVYYTEALTHAVRSDGFSGRYWFNSAADAIKTLVEALENHKSNASQE